MESLIAYEQYMPHGMCLLWQPWLLTLWAGSDLLIFLSYSAIPLALLSVLRQRPDLRHRKLVGLFAAFIMLCGLTHLFSIVTLWVPIYPQLGVLKLLTGVVSATTAVVLFRLVPKLVAIPSPRQLETANQNLLTEIASHQETLSELQQARDNLEREVAAQTAELTEVNAKLAVVAREAVHRSGNLLTVVSSLARQTARDSERTEEFLDTLLGRLHALAQATSTVLRGDDQAAGELEDIVRESIETLHLSAPGEVEVQGPAVRVSGEAAQQIALALHELGTNTRKYGRAEGARIRVSWSIEKDGEDGPVLDFRWNELVSDEPGNLAQKPGFGTKLLTTVIPAMLRGKAERQVEDGQLAYRLTVPMAAIGPDPDTHKDAALAARIVDQSFGVA